MDIKGLGERGGWMLMRDEEKSKERKRFYPMESCISPSSDSCKCHSIKARFDNPIKQQTNSHHFSSTLEPSTLSRVVNNATDATNTLE